jgi:hypothetical protein
MGQRRRRPFWTGRVCVRSTARSTARGFGNRAIRSREQGRQHRGHVHGPFNASRLTDRPKRVSGDRRGIPADCHGGAHDRSASRWRPSLGLHPTLPGSASEDRLSVFGPSAGLSLRGLPRRGRGHRSLRARANRERDLAVRQLLLWWRRGVRHVGSLRRTERRVASDKMRPQSLREERRRLRLRGTPVRGRRLHGARADRHLRSALRRLPLTALRRYSSQRTVVPFTLHVSVGSHRSATQPHVIAPSPQGFATHSVVMPPRCSTQMEDGAHSLAPQAVAAHGKTSVLTVVPLQKALV